jgi:hypothetical protein
MPAHCRKIDRSLHVDENRGMTNNSHPDDIDPASEPNSPGAQGSTPAAEPIAPEVLKSAYNAFKKRWKLTRLDYDSRIGHGPLSGGQKSAIVGIAAPREFPKAVWEELVKQGRLKHAGPGLYALR